MTVYDLEKTVNSGLTTKVKISKINFGQLFIEINIENISVSHGSTTLLESGGGTFHSRCTVMAGNAVKKVSESLIKKALELAALRWNVSIHELCYKAGSVIREDGERLTLKELAVFASTR